MYGKPITRINPGAGLMDCLLVMGKPMFPGNRSDRSKRSDRYPLSGVSLLYSGNARLILKVAVSSDYILVPLIYGTRIRQRPDTVTRIIQMITDCKKPSSCG